MGKWQNKQTKSKHFCNAIISWKWAICPPPPGLSPLPQGQPVSPTSGDYSLCLLPNMHPLEYYTPVNTCFQSLCNDRGSIYCDYPDVWRSMRVFFNITVEVCFTYHTFILPFKVYNSVVFSIVTELSAITTINFRLFLPPKEIPYPLDITLNSFHLPHPTPGKH